MSLDNTSCLGGPGPDELVPSRYALRVGEIDVLVVSDGVLSLPGAMLAHNADPAIRANWLENMFLPPDMLEWALNVVVVRSGGRTILIDAGSGADPELNLPRAGRMLPETKYLFSSVNCTASSRGLSSVSVSASSMISSRIASGIRFQTRSGRERRSPSASGPLSR